MPTPSAATRTAVLDLLVTDHQIAVMRGATLSTVRSWIDRYEDFPAAVLGEGSQTKYYWWPTVEKYCEASNLPRNSRSQRS